LKSTHDTIEKDLITVVSGRPGNKWWISMALSFAGILIGLWGFYKTLYDGIGTWGLTNYVAWGVAITNFVWWIGIAHAGTFISSILLLFRQRWRMSVNRSAETMTILAVMIAAIFPVIHLGRIFYVHYLMPIPTQSDLWINFNSPLVWDVFAISTYLLVSLLFWYTGLIPDFALLAIKTNNRYKKKIYKWLSMGWYNTGKMWNLHHKMIYYMATIAAPLVISVHSVVSNDFAVTPIAGWHSTIFPPFFVVGAVYSGFAMTQILIIIIRNVFRLDAYIDLHIIETINKIIMLTGMLLLLAYANEMFTIYLSSNQYEIKLSNEKLFGSFSPYFYLMIFCNCILPQLLWWKRIRTKVSWSVVIAVAISVGMWLERYIIVINSLENCLLPVRQSTYHASWVEVCLFIGSCSFFILMFLLMVKFIPLIAINEMKSYKGHEHYDKTKKIATHTTFETRHLIAVFACEKDLVQAYEPIKTLYGINEIITPNHVEVSESIKSTIPGNGLIAGITGGILAFGFQYWVMVIKNPMVYGGKPLFSFPSFVPVIFECAVLFAVLAMFVTFVIELRRIGAGINHDKSIGYGFMIITCAENKTENKQQLMQLGAIDLL